MAKCPDCRGPKIGVFPPEGDGFCSTCDGEGRFPGFLTSSLDRETGTKTPCTECGLTGQCQTCGGTGVREGSNLERADDQEAEEGASDGDDDTNWSGGANYEFTIGRSSVKDPPPPPEPEPDDGLTLEELVGGGLKAIGGLALLAVVATALSKANSPELPSKLSEEEEKAKEEKRRKRREAREKRERKKKQNEELSKQLDEMPLKREEPSV